MCAECHLGQGLGMFLMVHMSLECLYWFIQATEPMYYTFIWPKTLIFLGVDSIHFQKISKFKIFKRLTCFDLYVQKMQLGQHKYTTQLCTI